MWPLALLVFIASILVPMLKLAQPDRSCSMHDAAPVGLAFAATARWLYHMVDFIGRWSMIDVFMLSTLVGLVRDGQILPRSRRGWAPMCFASVVVLTMFAAITCFDPRLMWDAAGQRRLRGLARASRQEIASYGGMSDSHRSQQPAGFAGLYRPAKKGPVFGDLAAARSWPPC